MNAGKFQSTIATEPRIDLTADIDGIANTPNGKKNLKSSQTESQIYQSQLENMECKINLAKTPREKIEAALIGSSGSLMQTIIRSYLTLYK